MREATMEILHTYSGSPGRSIFGSQQMEDQIMVTAKKYGLLLVSTLLAATPISASTIDSINFSPADDSPFTSSLTESFSSTVASVTGTISCDSDSTCTGGLGQFFIGLDLTGLVDTPMSIGISGNLSGDTAGSGEMIIATIPEPFAIPTGDFDTNIFSDEIPPLGMIDVNGYLDLTLPPGETLTLPLTWTLGTAVPEPSSLAMLVLGLLGLAGVVRYRSSRTF
jgi:hypothetical protein